MCYLFIYGTLLPGCTTEVTGFLKENSSFISEGSFPGKLYEVDGYPGAIFLPDEKSRVFGHILKLQQAEKVLAVLDKYEEVGPDFGSPNEYVRNQIPVLNSAGQSLLCWVYLYNLPVDNLLYIHSGKYSGFQE